VIEIPGFVKIPRIRRGQFSPNEEVDRNCRLVYDKLYFHANFTPNKKSGLLKGQVIVTVKDLTQSCHWLTRQNLRTCLNMLVDIGMIKMERASKYREDGYKINIIDYGYIKLSTPCGTNQRLTNGVTNGVTNGSDDLRSWNDDEILMFEDSQQPTPQPTPQPQTNLTPHNKETKNNTRADDKSAAASTKPKKTRSPSKPKEHTPAHKVWLAYAEAYRTRYGGEAPYRPRNTYMIINTMLEQTNEEELAKRIKFYVEKFNDSKVIAAKHPITWLDSRMNEVVEAMSAQQPMKIRSF